MSTISDTQRVSRTNPFNVRAYLAGTGATTALVAAALIAFLAISALVAFNGLPFGLGGGDRDAVQISEAPAGAPEVTALLAGGDAPAAVAATPAAASALPPPPGAGSGAGGGSNLPGAFGGPGVAGGSPGTGAAPVGGGGIVGGAVNSLEQGAGDLGVDAPLGEVTRGITQPIDRTLNQTLNGVGGLLGNQKLGDQVSSGSSGLTKNLLP